MASSQISPKKYLETRVRSLPVYKCLVTKGWQEAGEAEVIIMRRHVNGNVTVGFYLVHLLCLGIKDTFYLFNEPESEVYDRLPAEINDLFEEAEYALAHNIVYAGHDFAMDFGIGPDKEFTVTKFILEEDNDNIPLIDIPVGDEDGLPHLVVNQPGDYSSAHAKLKQNAGEGNYRYTVTGLADEDMDDEEAYDEDFDSELLENYELGDISPLSVQYIGDDDLYDNEKMEMRLPDERITIITERAIRNLRQEKPELFDVEVEDSEEYDLLDETTAIACGVTEEEAEKYVQILADALSLENKEALPVNQTEAFRDLLHKHADKLLVVAAIYENEFIRNSPLLQLAKLRLEDLLAYPFAKLDLALANLLSPEPQPHFESIYDTADIRDLFPEADSLGKKELAAFWLIKTVQNVHDGNLKEAVRYYYLYSEIGVLNYIAMLVQVVLYDAILKILTDGNNSSPEA